MLGEQVWRLFCERGGLRHPAAVCVLGDEAPGIRTLQEQHLPQARRLLDPWHL